jgi:hypothetical protein
MASYHQKVQITEMPLVIAKLIDYGFNIWITNQHEKGSVTDFVIVQANCTPGQWSDAMERVPLWFKAL